MSVFDNLFDIMLTPDGDFARGDDGDLKIISNNSLLAQHIQIRLENSNPDWFYDPVAADMEDLLGLPNEKATADKGKQMILKALGDIVAPADILIQPVPVSKASIIFFVFINVTGAVPLGFEVKLALGSTINVKRVA